MNTQRINQKQPVQNSKSELYPGQNIKGKVLKIVDHNHYLVSLKGKRFLTFSEHLFQPGDQIFAKITGTFPNILLELLPFSESESSLLQSMNEISFEEKFFLQNFNQFLTDIPKLNESSIKDLFLFFKNQDPIANLLNQFENNQMPDHLKTLYQTIKNQGHLSLAFMQLFNPKPGTEQNSMITRLLEQLMIENPAHLSDGGKDMMNQSLNSLSGMNLFNLHNNQNQFFFPFFFFIDQKWYQSTAVIKKEKNKKYPIYLSLLFDFSFTGPLEVDLISLEEGDLILKFLSPRDEVLKLLQSQKEILRERIISLDMKSCQFVFKKEQRDIKTTFFFNEAPRSQSMINYQI